MRVLLVAPNYHRTDAPGTKTGKRWRTIFPPLSLLQVAALTPPEVEVSVQDEGTRDLDLDAPCDLVGITSNTSGAPRAYQIADTFRRLGRPVVMGGMHPTVCPEEALQHCDAVVVGEAEGKWDRLLADARQGRLQRIYRAESFPDVTCAPPPRRDLLPREDYLLPDTVQATRGCAHDCSFCSVTPFFGRRTRSKLAEAVAEDVSSLPGEYVVFVDDNIMTRPSYAQRLFESLAGAGKKWMGQASTVVLEDARLLKLAARSGCHYMFVGMESLSAAALEQVNKSFNIAGKFRNLIGRLHDVGIGVIGAFMFGFDTDDTSVFERTAEFADKARIDVPQYSILTPLPGTRLSQQMEREERIIDRNWRHYDGGHVVFAPRQMSPETLADGMRAALRHNYSTWSIFRRLAGIYGRLPETLAVNLEFRRRALNWTRAPGSY